MTTNERTVASTTSAKENSHRWRERRVLGIIGGILVGSALLFFLSDGRILSRFINEPAMNHSGTNDTGRRIQVSVLNGCGVPGIAMKVTGHLRSLGYDVVEIGNYETAALDRSMVIDWVNDSTVARKIAAALDVPRNRIIRKRNNRELVDFTVVLGKDYSQLIPLRQGGLVTLQRSSPLGQQSEIITQ